MGCFLQDTSCFLNLYKKNKRSHRERETGTESWPALWVRALFAAAAHALYCAFPGLEPLTGVGGRSVGHGAPGGGKR